MAAPPSQQPGQVTTDKLIGRSIQNAQNETIGEIEAVVLDPDGKVGAVVVGVGGFLGIGQRDVAIQWTALEVGSNGEKVTTALTKDQLKALPEYRYAEEKLRGTVFISPWRRARSARPSWSGSMSAIRVSSRSARSRT
jgi:hypothetical protein